MVQLLCFCGNPTGYMVYKRVDNKSLLYSSSLVTRMSASAFFLVHRIFTCNERHTEFFRSLFSITFFSTFQQNVLNDKKTNFFPRIWFGCFVVWPLILCVSSLAFVNKEIKCCFCLIFCLCQQL